MSAKNSELLFRTVLDTAAAAVMIEHGQRILYANERYASALGYSKPGDLIGRHVQTVIAEFDRDRLIGFSRSRADGSNAPRTYYFAMRCSDGTAKPAMASVSSATIDGECFITSILVPLDSDTDADSSKLVLLSPRERMVYDLLSRGTRPKQIALALAISIKTVTTLRGRLLRKLGLSDNFELYRFAERIVSARSPR